MAAIDDAIADGVDVLSISIGTEYPLPYIEDSIAIGALHACYEEKHCSVGNSGPEPSTLSHPAPWLLMMPKCSPVRYTIPTLEQPVPENKKAQRNAF